MRKNKRFSIMMPVYNDALLVKTALESIEPIADEIFIVEGCWFPNMGLRSTDGTIDLIEDFRRKYPSKTKIIYWDYNPSIISHISLGSSNRNALANSIQSKNLAIEQMNDSIWYFMVNADEIYKYNDLVNLSEYLKDYEDINEPFLFNIPSFVFYFSPNFGCIDDFHRINKLIDDKHTLLSEDILKYKNHDWPTIIKLDPELILMYHYSYVTSDRVDLKLKFYDKERADDWFNNVYLKNKENSSIISEDINYHLFSNEGQVRKFLKFAGTHPDLVIRDILPNFK